MAITALREALDRLANLAIDYDYDNVDDYSTYIGNKLNKIILHRRQQDLSNA